jgi:hypothetical protein
MERDEKTKIPRRNTGAWGTRAPAPGVPGHLNAYSEREADGQNSVVIVGMKISRGNLESASGR